MSATKKTRKLSARKSSTTSASTPTFIEALASAGKKTRKTGIVGYHLPAAEALVHEVIAGGILDIAPVETGVQREARKFLAHTQGSFRQAQDAINASPERLKVGTEDYALTDAVCLMRSTEIPLAYAVGLAVGLRIPSGV